MTNLKNTFETGLQELKTLRDEIRLKLHLAGQEARTQWETQIEPHVERIEQQIKDTHADAVETVRDTVKDAIERAKTAFQDFRTRLSSEQDRQALDETHRAAVKPAS